MNVELLLEVKKKILKEPRQFVMRNWFVVEHPNKRKIPNCGTAACIAGWVCAIAHDRNPSEEARLTNNFTPGTLLGIENEARYRLFFFNRWPDKFKKVPVSKEGTVLFARQAARRIDHFIKTNGAE